MKIQYLQSILKKGEMIVVSSSVNRFLLNDFNSSDGFLLITQNDSIFLTDSRYIEAAEKLCVDCNEITLLTDATIQLGEYTDMLGITKVFAEAKNLTVSELNRFKKIFGCDIDTNRLDSLLTELRHKKSENDKISCIEAQRIAEKSLTQVLPLCKPGVSERDIAIELDYRMLKNGAHGISFETIVISGTKTSMPHGVPGKKLIESGDFITFDFGAVINGIHSDMTRTIAVTQASEKMKNVYDTVLTAQLEALKKYKPGEKCSNVDKAARDIISSQGFGKYFGHGLGHGVGLEIHEAPSVSPKSRETLMAGDIVTCEPGIYIPGEFGVRIEDMLYISDKGSENLTNFDKKLLIL